jgi:hypothetical protein
MLEQRQAMNEEFANSQGKNILGRLSMKQQRNPESKYKVV